MNGTYKECKNLDGRGLIQMLPEGNYACQSNLIYINYSNNIVWSSQVEQVSSLHGGGGRLFGIKKMKICGI